MKRKLIGVFCASICLSAAAAEGKWTQGYGQGNLEYFIDQQGVRLYIACPTKDGNADASSSVSLFQIKNDAAVANFTIKINGHTFQGPFDTGSRVGENDFVALLDDLRKSDAVIKAGNRTIALPKSNASKVLPTSKQMRCNTF